MATEQNTTDPALAERVKKAAAEAREEVLNRSTMDALMKATPEDLIAPDPEAEVIKGATKPAHCWQYGPAMMQFGAAADKRLTKVAGWDNKKVKKVPRVHAFLLKGTKLLIIKPAHAEDHTALTVNRYRRSASAVVNLITLLSGAGLTVDTGYRERFDVTFIPRESPLWPGLLIDLGQPKESRRVTPKKKAAIPEPEEPAVDTQVVAGE